MGRGIDGASHVEHFAGRRRPDADVGIVAEHQTVVLVDDGVGADGGGIGQATGSQARVGADGGVV